jgi:hypothetical protein
MQTKGAIQCVVPIGASSTWSPVRVGSHMIIEGLTPVNYCHIQVPASGAPSKPQYLEDQLVIRCLDLPAPLLLRLVVLRSQMSELA